MNRQERITVAVLVLLILLLMPVSGCRSQRRRPPRAALTYRPTAIWDSKTVGTELDRILGIGIDGQGKVYATAGMGEDAVLVFDSTGKVVDSWGKGFVSKHGLRVFGQRVWVTDRQRHVVTEFTLDGKPLRTLGTEGKPGLAGNEFNMPSDVAIAPNGDIYVSDGYGNSRVMRFGADGAFKQSWGTKGHRPGQFDLVHNIAIDGEGRVYVADRENRRVQVFDAEGRFLDQWKHLGKPFGLCVDGDGNIYVTDGEADKVYVVDHEGRILAEFGGTGDEPGRFRMAHSIAVDRAGNIYVAEADGRRIQVFSRRR